MNHSKLSLFLLFVLVSSCGLRGKRYDGDFLPLPHYNLADPEKMILPQTLDEISGLTFSPEGALWVIEDESSIIYELQWPDNKILRKSKFAKNMDVEDVIWTGKALFALKSNGDVYAIHKVFGKETSSTDYDFPFKGKRDFESLGVFDQNHLILYCKECELDDDKNVASAFLFNTSTGNYSKLEDFKLTEKDLRKLLPVENDFKLTIKPAAIALHPIQNKFYVLSSVGKWLLIMDRQGRQEGLYRLDPRQFKQAEGIAFSPNGDLYISNEARDGNANILKFSYRP